MTAVDESVKERFYSTQPIVMLRLWHTGKALPSKQIPILRSRIEKHNPW